MYDPNQLYVRLPLENAGNVRDLGGYPADGGKVVKFKRFLRAGTLAYLQDWEAEFLIDYGVRTIIDLRTSGEAEREPNPLEHRDKVRCLSVPLLLGDITNYEYEHNNPDALSDMYIHIFRENPNMIAEVICKIANAGDGIILYNCSAGKDRTGVLSYILLALVGVSQEDIIANYQITETYYLPLFEKYTPGFDKIPMNYLRSQAKNIKRTMGFIESNFVSVKDYLLKYGVVAADIEKVRQRLLN